MVKLESDRYGNGSSGSRLHGSKARPAMVQDVIDLCASDSDDSKRRHLSTRKKTQVKEETYQDNITDGSSDSETERTGFPRPRPSSQPSAKLYATARILSLATDTVESVTESESKLASVEAGVLSRIKKSLALAKHAGTGEAEARQALRLATRLMSSQNLTQADLLASSDAESNQQRAGMSEVAILSHTAANPRNESWVNQVAIAINLFFDVKAYSTSYANRTKLNWTFYGLAVNTVAAAYAFEMVHNQVLTWAAEKAECKQISGKAGKNSYCQGVAAGLIALAKKEKKEELQIATNAEARRLKQASQQEAVDRKKQTERLHDFHTIPKREPAEDIKPSRNVKLEDVPDHDIKPLNLKRSVSEEANDLSSLDHGGCDTEDDSDDAQQWHDTLDVGEEDIKPHFDEATETSIIDLTADDSFPDIKPKTEPKQEEQEITVESVWHSSGQLVRFRQDAEKIADDYLASQHSGIKLKKRARSTYKKDSRAYEQGRQDARKIDVKRKRIEN